VEAADAMVAKSTLHQAYNAYCEQSGRAGMTATAFGLAVKRVRPKLSEAQRTVSGKPKVKVWVGIGIKDETAPDPPPTPDVRHREPSSPGSLGSPGSPGFTNCFLNEAGDAKEGGKGEGHSKITNKENPVNSVNRVNAVPPSVEAALDAIRNGNAPGMVAGNVREGTQKLPDLARSVMNYYGAKSFDGWKEWLASVTEAFYVLYAEAEEQEEAG
jgi:hypothetical protein